MNNKGLTIIELITTFLLTAVIVVLLINVIVVIKNVYSKNNIKSELYINQSNLSNQLNSKINNNNLDFYEKCTDEEFCYIFNFLDGEVIKLTVTDEKIKFGEYIYKKNKKTNIGTPSIETTLNNILVLKIPIESKIYPDIDFGINLIYQYDK